MKCRDTAHRITNYELRIIAVAKAMRVFAPFDSAQGAKTLIALTALAVAIFSPHRTRSA